MQTILDVISVILSTGAELPFRSIKAKESDNIYWATLSRKGDGTRYYNKQYGVTVSDSVVGGELPTSCTVLGVTFPMTHDTNTSGNPRAKASGRVTVDGVEKQFSLRISKTAQGFNVNGAIRGLGGGNGSNTFKAVDAL